LEVTDELRADDWSSVEELGIGPAQTSIYVVMSRTYQAGQLQPWVDLTKEARNLSAGAPLRLARKF
jgi:aromatic ring-cleaving dioxygenase